MPKSPLLTEAIDANNRARRSSLKGARQLGLCLHCAALLFLFIAVCYPVWFKVNFNNGTPNTDDDFQIWFGLIAMDTIDFKTNTSAMAQYDEVTYDMKIVTNETTYTEKCAKELAFQDGDGLNVFCLIQSLGNSTMWLTCLSLTMLFPIIWLEAFDTFVHHPWAWMLRLRLDDRAWRETLALCVGAIELTMSLCAIVVWSSFPKKKIRDIYGDSLGDFGASFGLLTFHIFCQCAALVLVFVALKLDKASVSLLGPNPPTGYNGEGHNTPGQTGQSQASVSRIINPKSNVANPKPLTVDGLPHTML